MEAKEAESDPKRISTSPSLRPNSFSKKPVPRQKKKHARKASPFPFILDVWNSLSMKMAVRGSAIARKKRETKATSLSKK